MHGSPVGESIQLHTPTSILLPSQTRFELQPCLPLKSRHLDSQSSPIRLLSTLRQFTLAVFNSSLDKLGRLIAAMAGSRRGSAMLWVIGCCAIMLVVGTVNAADPDPLQDFCVADLSPNAPLVNGFACKPRSNVTVKDFVYSGFRVAGGDIKQAPTGAIAALAGPAEFPGINTQGITHARLDFAVGGVVPLHTHPRASETLFVLKGRIYTGFVSDDNVLYATTLEKGDVILFPRALLHFQLNVGNESAITFNSLTSQKPGLLLTANQIFTPNISVAVIEKSFGVDAATAKLLKGSYPGHP